MKAMSASLTVSSQLSPGFALDWVLRWEDSDILHRLLTLSRALTRPGPCQHTHNPSHHHNDPSGLAKWTLLLSHSASPVSSGIANICSWPATDFSWYRYGISFYCGPKLCVRVCVKRQEFKWLVWVLLLQPLPLKRFTIIWYLYLLWLALGRRGTHAEIDLYKSLAWGNILTKFNGYDTIETVLNLSLFPTKSPIIVRNIHSFL